MAGNSLDGMKRLEVTHLQSEIDELSRIEENENYRAWREREAYFDANGHYPDSDYLKPRRSTPYDS